ncbi:hypothetical protein EDB87DRAFT_1681358 [Lactarius vividus]|nr:hypothetical protein EDB87DRAFT_1681358 [Lactarius vividus]
MATTLKGKGEVSGRNLSHSVTFDLPERATTPPRDPPPAQFVAWEPTSHRHPLDATAQVAEEAEARERLWKYHEERALHLRAAILSSRFATPQDPPQGPED